MLNRTQICCLFLTLACLSACAGVDPMAEYVQVTPTTIQRAEAEPSDYDPVLVKRGAYLAELLACGTCHTNGALVGRSTLVNGKEVAFSGSDIGIAYSNPMTDKHPGVVYPANITPDPETGIGLWTDAELVRLIRTGVDNHARHQMSVMPWPGYARMTDEDATAIAAFLKSLKPVQHQVPANVKPGDKATAPFVHFGVYRSRQDL